MARLSFSRVEQLEKHGLCRVCSRLMSLRETIFTLAIASAVVLGVVVVGLIARGPRKEPVQAIPVKVAGIPGQTLPDEGGRPKEVSEQFQIFPRPELVESRANEADTLRVRSGQEEHIFVLYFVDALETTENHPQRVAEQARYFMVKDVETITRTGREAAAFVADVLKRKPFNVLTRWERVPNTLRYYAIIVVEGDDGRPVYLADLLMRRGYARVSGVDTFLPGDARDVPTYMAELQSLARKARETKSGIWGKAGPPE